MPARLAHQFQRPRNVAASAPDNSRKAFVNCRSNAVIQLLPSLDSFKAGRPPTVQGGLLSEPVGSTTNRSPSISRSVTGAQLHGDPQPIGRTTTDGNEVAVRTC